MKIAGNDLDASLNKKIDRLDNVVDKFVSDDVNGFLAYDGNNFYIRKTNDVFLRKIFSDKEIKELELGINSKEYKNAFFSDVIEQSNTASINFKTSSVTITPEDSFVLNDDSIRIAKNNIILTKNGVIYIKEKIIDIISVIRSNFAVVNFYPYDILDVEAYGEESILISTTKSGVLCYNYISSAIEIKFPEQNVTFMKALPNNGVLCAMGKNTGNVCVYNFEHGKKTDSFNHLKKAGNQQAIGIYSFSDEDYLILGRTFGINQSQKILHYFKMDKNKTSIDCYDGLVAPSGLGYNYSILNANIDENYFYISGIQEGKMFVLQYSNKHLSDQPKFSTFKNLDINDIKYVYGLNGNIYVLLKNKRFLEFDVNGNVIKNIFLDSKQEFNEILSIKDDNVLLVSSTTISKFIFPEYTFKDTLSYVIYNELESCNNIDILIRSNGIPSIIFVDADSSMEIIPSYKLINNNKLVYKLLGSKAKKILIKIGVTENLVIDGICVSPNKIYLR